jgi:hypothetical protein
MRHCILIVLKEKFDNFRGVNFFRHPIDGGDDLSEPERLGRVGKDLVASEGHVAEIAKKFRMTEFVKKWT